MRRTTITVALAVLLVLGGLASAASALPVQDTNTRSLQEGTPTPDADDAQGADESDQSDHPLLDRLLNATQERYDLTDGQVAELESLVLRLHDDGASRAEIGRAVAGKLVEFGVDQDRLRRDARTLRWAHALETRFGLSNAEARDLLGDARRLHADGASRGEVREYVRDRLAHETHDGPHFAWYAEYLGLSDEQVTELQAVAEEAREDGAYPAEVRAAVVEQLRSYGYTTGDLEDARWAHRVEHLQIRFDLTDEQVAEIDAEVDRLVANDALDVEVRAAVVAKLREFDAIPDEYPRAPPQDRPRGPAPESPDTAS